MIWAFRWAIRLIFLYVFLQIIIGAFLLFIFFHADYIANFHNTWFACKVTSNFIEGFDVDKCSAPVVKISEHEGIQRIYDNANGAGAWLRDQRFQYHYVHPKWTDRQVDDAINAQP